MVVEVLEVVLFPPAALLGVAGIAAFLMVSPVEEVVGTAAFLVPSEVEGVGGGLLGDGGVGRAVRGVVPTIVVRVEVAPAVPDRAFPPLVVEAATAGTALGVLGADGVVLADNLLGGVARLVVLVVLSVPMAGFLAVAADLLPPVAGATVVPQPATFWAGLVSIAPELDSLLLDWPTLVSFDSL